MSKHITTALLFILCNSAIALEVTKEVCISTLTELGLPVTPYEFNDGWLKDSHVFNDSTECYKKDGHIFIKSDGDIYAEQGFFGKKKLAARDVVLDLQAEEEKLLTKTLNEKIEEIMLEHSNAVSNLESKTEDQLDVIRNDDIPKAIQVTLEEDLAKKEKKKTDERIEKEMENKKGFHCLSSWDGSHKNVVKAVKKVLNDPSSFDHVSTYVAPELDGKHQFEMSYRAKNSFGALMLSKVVGSFNNSDCKVISVN